MSARICASIAIYQPKLDIFSALLESLSPQVDIIIFVCNSTVSPELKASIQKSCRTTATHFIPMEKNVGISAHNESISWAKENNFEYILFSDQDSCPANDMVEKLLTADAHLRQQNKKIAAVGPRSVDGRTAESGHFLYFSGFAKKKCFCHTEDTTCRTDSLMLSGMLIKLETFDKVGLFDSQFFMDNLDTEWGLRATDMGYLSYGVCDAKLTHHVGDFVINFLGKSFYIHQPWRQYYIFRNRILLYKKKHVPLAWKFNDMLHIWFKIILHSIAIPSKKEYLKNIFKGLRDGIFSRSTI